MFLIYTLERFIKEYFRNQSFRKLTGGFFGVFISIINLFILGLNTFIFLTWKYGTISIDDNLILSRICPF